MNTRVFFVSDLHGKKSRYQKLLTAIRHQLPGLVLLGGDLLPHPRLSEYEDFLLEFFAGEIQQLKKELKENFPVIGLILGNDDARVFEKSALEGEQLELWKYLHMKQTVFSGYTIAGYSYVPPTPFLLKDWERYDVSRYVDPGCIPPTEGKRTVEVNQDTEEFATMQKDIETLTENMDLKHAVLLFHSPPYQTYLDRAALDNKSFENVPLDVHVGSIAIKRFIEEKQPYITLHGHIHESSSITGVWQQKIGNTYSFSAACEKEELALVIFDLNNPAEATRTLL